MSRQADLSWVACSRFVPKLAIDFVRDHRVRRWGTPPRRWRETAFILGLRFPKDCTDPAKANRDEIEVIKGSLGDSWRAKPISLIDSHGVYVVLAEAKKKGIAGLPARTFPSPYGSLAPLSWVARLSTASCETEAGAAPKNKFLSKQQETIIDARAEVNRACFATHQPRQNRLLQWL